MRRKIEDRNVRKLYKHSASYAMTLPKEMIKEIGWKEKQKLVVERRRGGIFIRDWRRK